MAVILLTVGCYSPIKSPTFAVIVSGSYRWSRPTLTLWVVTLVDDDGDDDVVVDGDIEVDDTPAVADISSSSTC